MELEDFRGDFLETVKSHAAVEGDMTEAAFVTIASQRLMDAEEFTDFEPCYHEGNGIKDRRLKLRVDGSSFDDVDGSAKILIADYRGGAEAGTLTQTDAKNMFSRVRAFVSESMSGMLHTELEQSSPACDLASDIYNRGQSISRFRFFLVTDAIMSNRIKDWVEDYINQIPVEFHIWDIARFHSSFIAKSGRDELLIDFQDFTPDGIPCLEAGQNAKDYKAYLCVIPGEFLADLYDRYGSRLLERNVRSFLGARATKNNVNNNMKKTILHEAEKFFAYNNGIAATASHADVVQRGSGLYLTTVADLQIVNGGQTTASLSTTRNKEKADLSNIFVQMKLSIVTSDPAEDMIPNISRFANSQNKVSDADLASNREFHVRMETLSRRIGAPPKPGTQYKTFWFYERARAQYLNEQSKGTKKNKDNFLMLNPREQLITKTDLAKYENAWRRLPHTVSHGAQKNFNAFEEWVRLEWERAKDDFNEQYFQNLVVKAILWKSTERMVSDQEWYQKGYRANIVAYTIARLSLLIDAKGRGKILDFKSIWDRQQISQALIRQLEIIAEEVFDVITDTSRPVENVTEWCKRKMCWDKVESLELSLRPDFANELVDKGEHLIAVREARVTQKIDNGVEAQTFVFKRGASYWQRLLEWGHDRRILSPDEESFVRVAAQMPHKIPSEKQCMKILVIMEKVEADGFAE